MTYGTAGPLATQVLADMGPDMVRVDTPDDFVRRQQGSVVRLRGRRSIFVDPDAPAAGEVISRLIAWTDVLVTEPGIDSPLPLAADYVALSKLNRRIISSRITAYGDEGPLTDEPPHDHLVAARHGVYDQPGWRDGPTFLAAPAPSLGAALLAVQAIGSALYVRERTGEGQEIRTSLLAGALAFQPGMINASVQRPIGDAGLLARAPFGAAPFYSIYACGDGNYLHFGCLTPEFQRRAVEALDLDKELGDLGFGTPDGMKNRALIIETITARMRQRSYAEWAAIFEAADIPHAPAQWTEELIDDPQVRHMGLLVQIDDPEVGRTDQMGQTVHFRDAPWSKPRHRPLPGEHTDEICRLLGFNDSEIEQMKHAGAVRQAS